MCNVCVWVSSKPGSAIEGLVEQELNIHNSIMVARGLCCAQSDGTVVHQMVDIGPETVTLYKGTGVAMFSPRNHVMVPGEEGGVKAGGGHTNSNGLYLLTFLGQTYQWGRKPCSGICWNSSGNFSYQMTTHWVKQPWLPIKSRQWDILFSSH